MAGRLNRTSRLVCRSQADAGQDCNTIASALSYKFAPKKSGPPRLIESPKPQLKAMQRLILGEILSRVPAHDCAHGFVRRHSCLTAAEIHTGEHVLITADLKDFFLNTRLSRVHGVFRNLGYPHPVSRLLTTLCSTSTRNRYSLDCQCRRGMIGKPENALRRRTCRKERPRRHRWPISAPGALIAVFSV